ncbi:MAG: SPOR domain-containing protein [Saprospiraceae bacterium]
MKNLINVLLYVLLGLLVVTISVMIYKKFKAPSETPNSNEVTEQSYVDTSSEALPFSAEDSIILGLTGELPNKVGPDTDVPIPQSGTQVVENVSPVAKPVVMHESAPKISSNKPVEEIHVAKAETKVAAKTETKTSKVETKVAAKTETKAVAKKQSKVSPKSSVKESTKSNGTTAASSNNHGHYYVVSGSFLVPSNADNQVAKLKKLGFFNAMKKVFNNSSSYSAIAGQYESEAAAKATLSKLKAKGEAAFIKKM